MKKKGKTYKVTEPYKLGKPVKKYSETPRTFRIIKLIFMVLICVLGAVSIVTLIMKYYHIVNGHKH